MPHPLHGGGCVSGTIGYQHDAHRTVGCAVDCATIFSLASSRTVMRVRVTARCTGGEKR